MTQREIEIKRTPFPPSTVKTHLRVRFLCIKTPGGSPEGHAAGCLVWRSVADLMPVAVPLHGAHRLKRSVAFEMQSLSLCWASRQTSLATR